MGDGQVALRYAVASNVGATDAELYSHAAYAGPHLLVIAEGLHGMSDPGRPSQAAVEELRRLEVDVPADAPGLAASLERGIQGLRETFSGFLAPDPRLEGTGVLLTAMLWRGAHAAIAHIGSTRAYMLRGGELTQLTRDHTVGQLLAEAGTIKPGEVGSDPQHALIVRWLDGKPGEPADITTHEAAVGDRYVLCTDGMSHLMSPGTLLDILRGTAGDPQDGADEVAGMAFPVERYRAFTCIVADVVGRPG
jgi:PPM family protein phosphatase